MKKILILFTALLTHIPGYSQCPPAAPPDMEFWFGVPQWLSGFNSPQKIHLTGAEPIGSTSCYVIDMPANAGFTPISGSVAGGGSAIVDMTSFIATITAAPANTIVNAGLRIRTWGHMEAYYTDEKGDNYGSIPLRGPNALGASFIIPGQNIYTVGSFTGAKAQFIITATADSTLVTINPSEAIVGHGAGVPFSITLNKGQSFQAQDINLNGIHLAGSIVSSTNLVVVTYIDDLIGPLGVAADNGGDQLVPINKLGNDYVQIRTHLTIPESIFLTGTQNGTTITVFDGTTTSTFVVNINQTQRYDLPAGKNVAYIHSDKPIMAYQLGGQDAELGSGILTPVVNCKGTNIVAFQYPFTATSTYFNLVAAAGTESGFTYTDSGTSITPILPSDFLSVPGYPGWKYVHKQITGLTPGHTLIISNPTKFFFYQNIGSVLAGVGDGGDFSNFSDFGNIVTFPKLGYTCGAGSISLFSNIIAYNTSITNYNWAGPNGFTSSSSNTVVNNPGPTNQGSYILTVTDANGCTYKDSVYMNAPITAVIVQPEPSTACTGSSVTFNSSAMGGEADSIRWTGPNGFTSTSANFTINNIATNQAGTYTCRYYDKYACYKDTSVTIAVSASVISSFAVGGYPVLNCGTAATTLSATGYTQGIQYATFQRYQAPSLYASSDFTNLTSGFYNVTPTDTGIAAQMNLSGVTGVSTSTKNFGMQYKGFLNIITAGSYTFYLNSYDGSDLYIDSSLLVNNDGTHALAEVSSQAVTLTAGYHSITVNYFKDSTSTNAALTVSYAGPSIPKTALPAAALYYPGGTAPAGLTYTWYDVASNTQVGTGNTFTATTPGRYRLQGSNGCQSSVTYDVIKADSYDYSDLPSPWPTAQAKVSGCPSASGIPSGTDAVWAGAGVSTEVTPGTNVNSDTYDDGLSGTTATVKSGAINIFSVFLNSNTNGKTVYYGLWFDWNNDGNFANDIDLNGNSAFYSGSGTVITAGTSVAVNVSFLPPLNASKFYSTRLIVSDQPIMFPDFDNTLSNGEVEDYMSIVPLPVELMDFTAHKQNNNVLLQWDVAAEINTDRYEVEWCYNMPFYQKIGEVSANGAPNTYTLLHQTPVTGVNYYRLKMIDRNGGSTYSNVCVIKTNANGESIVVNPNPLSAAQELSIQFSSLANRKTTISVCDPQGDELLRQAWDTRQGTNKVSLNVNTLSPGIYYLRVFDAETEWSLPVQKICIIR